MATSEATLSASTTIVHEKADESVIPTMRLKLKKPKSKKKVAWTADTVDNEHMNKRKSKCCCIYEKPRAFGESSSESDDECDHCKGHVEKKSSQLKSHGEEHTLLPVGAAKGK